MTAADYVHALWCGTRSDEGHKACQALLGSVVAAGGMRVDVRLFRAPEGPTVATLTLADRVVVLNVEHAHLLEAVLRQAVSLMVAGRPNG